MKRALLIAGGTVGGLGAVLSITPPQLDSQSAIGGLANVASATPTSPATQTTATSPATPAATPPSTAATSPKAAAVKQKVTKKKAAVANVATKATVTTPSQSAPATAATTPAATTPAPAAAPVAKKVSGTFSGNVVNVNYGNVQVQITVVNGKITDAQALQAPTGRSDRYTQYAVPVLRAQTLAAQGSNIQGASGASYTSYGWYTSLQAALAKAGL